VNKFINFEVESTEIIEENPDSQFATARIQAFSSDKNRHDMYCSEDVLQKTASTIYDKPILYSIDQVLNDFYTHTEAGKSLIAGFVVPNSAEFIRLSDSRLALSVFAKIWKRYAPKVIELFQRDSLKNKKVSVEMELFDSEEKSDGLIEMKDFAYSGITLLGDFITEASPGANMQMLSFSEANEQFKEDYQIEFGKYEDEMSFNIPSEVQTNAKKGLDLYKKFERGGNSVSVAHAKHLTTDKKSTPEKVRHAHKYMAKRGSNKFDEKNPTNNQITFMLWGGEESIDWTSSLIEKMGAMDSRHTSYFGEGGIMPYGSLKDVNPALKGIEPPVSLGQANEIAKQADAIGSDEKKNGWSIAISQFKKNHKVEDGHWVKKEEKMAEEENKPEKEEMSVEKDEKVEEEKMAETPAEEKKEDPEEEKKETPEEEKKENMSLDAYLDVAATLAFLKDETESYKEVAAEFAKPAEEMNYAKCMGAMYAFMCKMDAMCKMAEDKAAKEEEEKKAYMAENEQLKKFKAEEEQKQFKFAVDSTLKSIEEKTQIPADELESLREKSKEFTIYTLDAWTNLAKARGLDFALKGDKKDDGVKRYGLPFPGEGRKVSSSPWSRQ